MIWLATIAAVLVTAALVWWTFYKAARMQRPFVWNAVAASVLTLGIFPGFWYGFGLRYAVGDTIEFQGFPIPLAFFVLEEGQWIDYIGFPPLGLLNVFLIDSALLSPFSLAMFVVSLRERRTPPGPPRTKE